MWVRGFLPLELLVCYLLVFCDLGRLSSRSIGEDWCLLHEGTYVIISNTPRPFCRNQILWSHCPFTFSGLDLLLPSCPLVWGDIGLLRSVKRVRALPQIERSKICKLPSSLYCWLICLRLLAIRILLRPGLGNSVLSVRRLFSVSAEKANLWVLNFKRRLLDVASDLDL